MTPPNAPIATVASPPTADEQRHVVEWAREKVALSRDDFPHWLAEQVLKLDAALLAARRENETLRTAANAVIKEHRRLSNLVMGGDTPSLLDLEDAIAALAATETR